MNTKTEATIKCPECGSPEVVKSGKVWSGREQVQRYLCNKCGRLFIEPRKESDSVGVD